MSPTLLVLAAVLGAALVSMPVFALAHRGRRDPDAERKGSSFLLGVGDFLVHWFMWAIGPVERALLGLGASPDHMNAGGPPLRPGERRPDRPRPPRGGGGGDRARRGLRHPGRAARPGAEGGLALRQVHRLDPRPLRRDLRLPRLRRSTSPARPWGPLVVAAGLGGSLLVSYAQARGETVGVSGSGGLMQRAERLVLQILGCLFDPTAEPVARDSPRAPCSSGSWSSPRSAPWAPPSTGRPGSRAACAAEARRRPGCAGRGREGENLASPESGADHEGGARCPTSYPVKPHVAARSHLNSTGGVRAALPPVARQPRVVLGGAGQGAQLVPPLADRLRRRLRRGGLRLVLRRGGSTPPSTASTGTSRRSATAPRSSGPRTRPGPYRHISYRELKHNVCRVANVLLSHGVRRGDRVCIYMRMMPGARLHDAGLRAHRRRALRGLRRVQLPRRCATGSWTRAAAWWSPPTRGCAGESASPSRRPWTARSRACRWSRPSSWPAAPSTRSR